MSFRRTKGGTRTSLDPRKGTGISKARRWKEKGTEEQYQNSSGRETNLELEPVATQDESKE